MTFLIGIFLGTISSFLGIGGGVFLVPLLPLLYPLTPYEAIVLSLTFIFFSVSTNTIIFTFQKKVVWNLVLHMGPRIIIGGFIGSKVASLLQGIYLKVFLIIFLLLMSLSFLKSIFSFSAEKNSERKGWLAHVPSSVLGLFAGILSGLAGVGSGVFLNWLVLKDHRVKANQESPTVNAMMIFVCSGVFVSTLITEPGMFKEFYFKVGGLNIVQMIFGIVLGAYIGKALNAKNFNRARVILLFLITFSLANLTLYETIFKRF